MAQIATTLKKLPSAVPRCLANIQKLQRLHKMVSDRRDRLAPIAYHTWERLKQRNTWHPAAHAWVDEKLPMSRQDFAEYNWYKRDLQRLVPLVAPAVLGLPLGVLVLGAWMSKLSNLPSAFSDKTDIAEIKYQFYEEHMDDIRQQVGPMLQSSITRLYRGHMNREHIFLTSELVESYKETFLSHHTGIQRDVRKCEHMKYFDMMPTTLLMTNKDPLELTPKLEKQMASCTTEEELREVIIAAYKEQEAHGGISTNQIEALALPGDEIMFEDNPKDDYTRPPENFQPIENLKLTGDRVFVPNEVRSQMEDWTHEVHKRTNQFLGINWRFSPAQWNQLRLVKWYEQMLQEDALIARDGGIQKLSDLELKVALLDRAVMRVDENLTRGDMEARYKEISYLMGKRTTPAVIVDWQTGFFRTTYSPEDDLPEASIVPQYNRTRLDVDTHNRLEPDARGKPVPHIHPAYFPDAHKALMGEIRTV